MLTAHPYITILAEVMSITFPVALANWLPALIVSITIEESITAGNVLNNPLQ